MVKPRLGSIIVCLWLTGIALNPLQGPTPTKQLQPPGFFAINYGRATPVVTQIAHIVYGGMLGFFYH